ncbi:phosphoethanolamine transferase domain-containing protein [Phytobacter palmae]|uniref:Phosphoethanolamine transferase domain-containing protein n=1 Tax=Phytobacter palmae TaxID=1855371 RepID=A0ABU9VBJ3_9ENTR
MFLRPSSFRLNPVQLTWVAALFFTTVGNISLWQTLWLQIEFCSIDQVLFFISLPVSLFCCINLFLTPLMILPYLRKPLLVVLVIISAGCTYFMLRYDILIDRNMVQSLFAGATAAKLILSFSMPLALSLFFLGVLPAAAIIYIPTKKPGSLSDTLFWWLSHILVTLTLFAAILLALYKDYASLLRDNRHIKDQVVPFNIVRNTHSYLEQKSGVKPHSLRAVAKRASRVVMLSGAKSAR